MSALLKKHWIFLQFLLESECYEQKKAILDTITRDQLKVLSEIAHNLIQGILPISTPTLNRLRKHRSLIELLGDRKASLLVKKRAVKKRPFGILDLLKALAPTLSSMVP